MESIFTHLEHNGMFFKLRPDHEVLARFKKYIQVHSNLTDEEKSVYLERLGPWPQYKIKRIFRSYTGDKPEFKSDDYAELKTDNIAEAMTKQKRLHDATVEEIQVRRLSGSLITQIEFSFDDFKTHGIDFCNESIHISENKENGSVKYPEVIDTKC